MTTDFNARTGMFAAPKDDTDVVNLMQREKSTRPVSHTLSCNAPNINLSTTRTALLLSPLALAACGGEEGESGGESPSLTLEGDGESSSIVLSPSSWILSGLSPYSKEGKDSNTVSVFGSQINGDGRTDFVITKGVFPPGEIDAFSPALVLSTLDGYKVINIESDTKFTHASKVAFFDFDNDGDIDIFIVGHGWDTLPHPGEQNGLFVQEDDGSFLDMSYLLPQINDFSHSLAVGDINKDGFLDVYIGNIYGSNLHLPYLLINDGGEGFISQPLRADIFDYAGQGGTYPASLLYDVNDDGDLELILGGDTTSNSMILSYNIEDGDFEVLQILPRGVFESTTITVVVKAGDVNGDGRTDIVMSQTSSEPFYYGRGLQILLQQEDGSFIDASSTSVVSFDRLWLHDIELIDYDNDGDLDIIGVLGAFGAFIFENDGSGSFSELNNGNSVNNSENFFNAIDDTNGNVFGFKFLDDIQMEQFL